MEERFEQTVQYTLASRLQTAKRIGLDDRQEWQARDLRRLLPFGISDTHLWDLIDSQQRVLQVPGAGTWKHARTVRKIESRLIGGAGSESSVSLVSIPFARSSTTLAPIHHGAFQVARHLAETETYRRWTLTAVGVRQYRNQFEQWPEGLRQLSRVGLTANDWEFEPGKPFGNHVSKDGTEFRLWIPDIDDYLSNPNVHRLEVDNRYLPTELNSSRTIDEDRIVRLKLD